MKFTRSVMFTLIALIGLMLLPEIVSAQVVQAGIVVATDCKRTATQTVNTTVYLTVNQLGQLCVEQVATTISSGLTLFDLNSLTTLTSALNIKASAGQIYGLTINPVANATTVWVNFYNALASDVTMGTTSALFSIMVPAVTANAATTIYPIPWVSPIGLPFSTALSFSCTTTAGGATKSASTCRASGLFK